MLISFHTGIYMAACVCIPMYVCPLNCTVCVSACSCVLITLCIRGWSGVLCDLMVNMQANEVLGC